MGHDREKPSFFRLFQVIVVLAWIVGFGFLSANAGGTPMLAKFLRPGYWWLVEMGTAILVLFLISLAYCDPLHRGRRGIGLFFQIGIMLLPLWYLPTAVRSELSPEAVKKRSFSAIEPNLSAEKGSHHQGPESAVSANKAPDADANSPEDTPMVRLVLQAGSYDGKRVTTMGKVCMDDQFPEDSFFCYRLLMICCAADARPIGVVVEYDKTKTLKTGDWVKIEGTVGFTTIKDHRVLKVAAERVEPAAPPKDQFVWP